jgi:glycosyltransferase involved in cell wall biosynthesis
MVFMNLRRFRQRSGVSIRILPELRAVQVKQGLQMVTAETWYFRKNYDMSGTSVPVEFVRVSLVGAVWRLLRTSASILEVPEPLWVRFLPTNVGLILAWRFSGALRFQSRKVRTYAIENNEPSRVIFGDQPVPSWVEKAALLAIGLFISRCFELVAFGTHGAAQSYKSLPFFNHVASRVVLGLPAPSISAGAFTPVVPTLIFVGSLHPRKGIDTLMRSWRIAENKLPNARIMVVGAGPLECEVARWVSESPQRRRFLGQLSHDELDSVISASTAIAIPSRRFGRWREQIGLPIEEGLALGLTVVCSDETGLASWLHENGHHVMPVDGTDEALSGAILSALTRPLGRKEVLATLPHEHARITADRWLHAPFPTD